MREFLNNLHSLKVNNNILKTKKKKKRARNQLCCFNHHHPEMLMESGRAGWEWYSCTIKNCRMKSVLQKWKHEIIYPFSHECCPWSKFTSHSSTHLHLCINYWPEIVLNLSKTFMNSFSLNNKLRTEIIKLWQLFVFNIFFFFAFL